MTSAKPSPLTSPMLTDEPASSNSDDDPRILNPFDPLMSVTSMTSGIPAMTSLLLLGATHAIALVVDGDARNLCRTVIGATGLNRSSQKTPYNLRNSPTK